MCADVKALRTAAKSRLRVRGFWHLLANAARNGAVLICVGRQVVGWTRRADVLRGLLLAGAMLCGGGTAAQGQDIISFSFPGADKQLQHALSSASLLALAEIEGTTEPLDLFSAARTDYGRLLGALYAEGYYSGVIHILIDGREAADFAAVDAPQTIGNIRVTIQPGVRFTFLRARMKPYAPGTRLPPAYRDGKAAQSGAIADAARAGVDGWRRLGYAKAEVVGQTIIADHRISKIDAEILLSAGPQVHFGKLNLSGNGRMTPHRIVQIAGFHEGELFDPETLDEMALRLRRTGVFRSVAITEADSLGPGNRMDIGLTLVEEAPRRFGFGAEVSSADGANLSAFWLHRNLFGGGERLRFDMLAKGIDSQNAAAEYQIGARLDRPGTPFTDSSAFVLTSLDRAEVLGARIDTLTLGFGLSRVLSDTLKAEAGLSYVTSSIKNNGATYDFKALALPLSVEWDRRDSTLSPTKGSYLTLGVTPFLGFGTTGSGAQIKADARVYKSVGANERLVLAGRVQLGAVVGSALLSTPPDYLFYSGGGGTVRGHPFKSLGVTVQRSGGVVASSGGLGFVGLSGEARYAITETLGAAAFYDAGWIGGSGLLGGGGNWQAGAGVGIRYDTGFGPIRLDVAAPVTGSTGNGLQVYVGIGQSF